MSKHFNPRSPHGERHDTTANIYTHIDISIHAPRTGSDMRWALRQGHSANFNPRSPHGERQADAVAERVAVKISIHAPRTGSDRRTNQ